MSSHSALLEAIIDARQLSAVFQPIIALERGEFVGYEGLIRGPSDSPLHAPADLFEAARAADRLFDLEHSAREITVRSFVDRGLEGSLFLNCCPESLTSTRLHRQLIDGEWGGANLESDRLVIEVTEIGNIEMDETFDRIVTELKQAGYRIAIDDIGSGFGNAVLWERMQPDLIKTDGRFASDSGSTFKRAFIRSLFGLANEFGVQVIVEGVESQESLRMLFEIGIDFAQGFLIQIPSDQPADAPSPALVEMIEDAAQPFSAPEAWENQHSPAIADLIERVAPITAETLNEEVAARLDADQSLLVLPVVGTDGTPLGVVHRFHFLNAFSRLYSRELYGRKTCTLMMQHSPLTFDAATPVSEVASSLSLQSQVDLMAGVIVTLQGRYQGMVGIQQLIGAISDLQLAAARYANPLTNLPGNVPINQQIDRMLASGSGFFACYIDIDRFKPFNDRYGFSLGDQLILALARAMEQCTGPGDFVGHIGGDDFLGLFVSNDWQGRLEWALDHFDGALQGVCSEDDLKKGGFESEDRNGKRVFHALPTVSTGAVYADARRFESHRDLSGWLVEAKKLAKQKDGHSLFIERRDPLRSENGNGHEDLDP